MLNSYVHVLLKSIKNRERNKIEFETIYTFMYTVGCISSNILIFSKNSMVLFLRCLVSDLELFQ